MKLFTEQGKTVMKEAEEFLFRSKCFAFILYLFIIRLHVRDIKRDD